MDKFTSLPHKPEEGIAMNITIDTIYQTIHPTWNRAIINDCFSEWFTVADKLSAMWDLILWSCDNVSDVKEILDYIHVLKMTAIERA
jgi:hypothetical protein